MAKAGFLNQQIYGEVLLERIGRSPHAGALKKEAQAFKTAQTGYAKACDKVGAAQGRRDDALAAIGAADGTLDKGISALADRLVGAGLGKRQNPFAGSCDYSPSRLTELAYAEEVKAAQKLVAALRKKKLPAEVAAAAKAVSAAAEDVSAALKELAAPQADYEAAMQARDGLLLGWNKALGRLKRIAAVAYDDDKAGYRALFAPAKDLQIKKRPAKAAKRKSRPAARPTPPPPPSP